MAKPSTTHVIEIETGIGEPAFIPLALDRTIEPLSLGRKGMWRIESAGVLDVHAFVYFDGEALFLQSADVTTPARVDGHEVGNAWAELRAPCVIELGDARLRFRSLLADSDDASTEAVVRPPVAPPTARTEPLVARYATPMTFPKADRAFQPDEDSALSRGFDSTRIGPVETMAARSSARAFADPPTSPVRAAPDDATKMEGVRGPSPARANSGPAPTPRMHDAPVRATEHSMYGSQQLQSQPVHGPPSTDMSYGPQPLVPPGIYPVGPAAPPNPASGPMSDAGTDTEPEPVLSLAAKYKRIPWPKRVLIGLSPFYLAAVAYLLFDDEARDDRARVVGTDAGTKLASTTSSGARAAPAVPSSQPACPPGFVPYNIALSGQVPCVPVGTPMAVVHDAAAPVPAPAPSASSSSTAPAASIAAGAKTLERQAVDQVALGNYAAAAAAYEQLHQQTPNNRAYAEAARILRAKADAGSP
ncbi:MAG TPA: hypothetical protein VM925_07715 [Labilithrix sp.]|nr:hypothetical protein [Labilithrix sp.]